MGGAIPAIGRKIPDDDDARYEALFDLVTGKQHSEISTADRRASALVLICVPPWHNLKELRSHPTGLAPGFPNGGWTNGTQHYRARVLGTGDFSNSGRHARGAAGPGSCASTDLPLDRLLYRRQRWLGSSVGSLQRPHWRRRRQSFE